MLDEHEAAESAYALEVLRPEFCAALVAAIDAARDPEDGDARPFPAANLDALGFGWLADALLHVTERVARIAYPSETLGVTAEGHARAALDWRHAYALRYAPADATSATVTRDSLVPHTDDSEVTLNVGLTEAFQGGALCLGGTRGQADERAPLEDRLQPRVGLGLVHLGRRLHARPPRRNRCFFQPNEGRPTCVLKDSTTGGRSRHRRRAEGPHLLVPVAQGRPLHSLPLLLDQPTFQRHRRRLHLRPRMELVSRATRRTEPEMLSCPPGPAAEAAQKSILKSGSSAFEMPQTKDNLDVYGIDT